MDEQRIGSALRATAKPPSPGQGSLRRTLCQPEVVVALVLSLVALGLHIMFLNHAGGFWRDEVNTVKLAGHSSAGAMARVSFPVLTPLLVHGWTVTGSVPAPWACAPWAS
jgi:hypothetical protein